MSINQLFSILKGGPTSGNFGHSGIPGKQGGSIPKNRLPSISPRFGPDYQPPRSEQLDTIREGSPIDDITEKVGNSFRYDLLEDSPKNLNFLKHTDVSKNKWGHFAQIVTDGKDFGVELFDCKNKLISGVFNLSKLQAEKVYKKVDLELS